MSDSCHVEPIRKTVPDDERAAAQTAWLAVWGMGCPNCAARVRNSLVALPGVVEAAVDHNRGLAEVLFNPAQVAVPALIAAVARAGGDGRHEYRAALIGL